MRSALAAGALALSASGAALSALIVLAGACGPVQAPDEPAAPVNACPQHSCALYSPAATCQPDGTCAAASPSAAGLILVASLPDDSFYAPSQQFVVPFEHLKDCTSPTPQCACTFPDCGHLPQFATVQGGYVMTTRIQSPETQGGVAFFLGNVGTSGDIQPTLLPVHATFRLLDDQFSDDVQALGLPLQPVQALQVDLQGPEFDRGPYGSIPTKFVANLPGGTYERRLSPDPPYDGIFAPEVRIAGVSAGSSTFDFDQVTAFDVTKEEPISHATLPTFDIDIITVARRDGWTAFLRDATTKRAISNVSPLTGAVTMGVRLLTNHLQGLPAGLPPPGQQPDALMNAQLILAPPDGAPLPAAVFVRRGGEFTATPAYPQLPPPVAVQGTVSRDGPVAADLVFEALAFVDASGTYNYSNFLEFVGHASAVPDAVSGQSSYQVTLPQGLYRVDVIPRDGASALSVFRLDVTGALTQPFVLEASQLVSGKALVSDRRPLALATIEAIPQACAQPAALVDAGLVVTLDLADTPWCLPRPAQTSTEPDGSFKLRLDPGSYTLRARPADGTHLPWAWQTIQVGAATPAPKLVVAAPFHTTFKLVDPSESPVVRTVVRAFFATPPLTAPRDPKLGPAVEIGEAFTGSDGIVDLYMALPQ